MAYDTRDVVNFNSTAPWEGTVWVKGVLEMSA